MDSLVIEPTAIAQWHSLVQEACHSNHYSLDHELEHYLVNVLMRSTQRADICSSALAIDYLAAANLQPQQKAVKYQDIGDQCLLLTGFWPERAHKRLVDTPYYVKLGRGAYWHAAQAISKTSVHLYQLVSEAFVRLMDILATMRDMMSPNLCLLTAVEKWQQLGSEHARKKLEEYDPNLVQSLAFLRDSAEKAAH